MLLLYSNLGDLSLFLGAVADLPGRCWLTPFPWPSAAPPCCHCSSVCVPQQEQRNILALAVGLKGIAAIRSVLSWAPVQAHATSHKVTAYYVTKSPQTAAFLAEWDQWREAGVSSSSSSAVPCTCPLQTAAALRVHRHVCSADTFFVFVKMVSPLLHTLLHTTQVSFNPLYTETLQQRSASPNDDAPAPPTSNGSSGVASASAAGAHDGDAAVTAEDIMGLLEQGLFLHEHGLESAIGGKASEATVLLAGIPGDMASKVAKELTFKGVAWERLLFCDYF